MPLERAIHKLTGEPAGVYGLWTAGPLRPARPPTSVSSTLRPWRPARCDGCATSRPTAERLTADAPVGMTHTLVNGVPIRVDGATSQDGLSEHPGVVLRG